MGKNLFLELNAKMLVASQIGGFLNFNISKFIEGIKLTFCMQVNVFKLQVDGVHLGGCGQACPGMHKKAIKTLRSQKLKEV